MRVTLDWLGTATFRLTVGDLIIFLDAYMDRLPTAPPVGMTTADVERADFVLVGHSHFDHLAGAETIAQRTGARVIGSNESCRVMRECGVPRDQLLPSQGGERHRLSAEVTVRVFPSLHACIWCGPVALDEERKGDLGHTEDERRSMMAERGVGAQVAGRGGDWSRTAREHMRSMTGSGRDGGPLVYLIETPTGSMFYQDTTGCWSGVLSGLRADVAILALSGRPNLDGEPYQGSLASFVAEEAAWLGARTVIFGHHDNWLGMPGAEARDTSAARAVIEGTAAGVTVLEPGYLAGTVLFE